jgi:hypothetical protein
MMTAKDVFRRLIESSHQITCTYIGDFSDADLLVRPAPGSNHVAWQLGHMIGGVRVFLAALGRDAPALPDGFQSAHSREAAASDDPARFATKAQYAALLEEMKAASLAAVDATPEADLDKPGPEAMREYAPTIGSILMLLGTHCLMHAGQFVPVRRKLGKPVLF